MQFPLNLEGYNPVKFDLAQKELTTDQIHKLSAFYSFIENRYIISISDFHIILVPCSKLNQDTGAINDTYKIRDY